MNSLALTRLVVAAQLRTLHSGWSRTAAWLAGLAAAGALSAAAASGDILRWTLSPEIRNTSGGLLVRSTVASWLGDGFIRLSALVLVAVLAGAVSHAVTSPTAPGLLDDGQRSAVRWTVTSRFAESWVASLLSLVPLMQLAALTALASLTSMDTGTHVRATLVAWATWLAASAFGQAVTWWAAAARLHPVRRTSLWAAAAGVAVAVLVAATWPAAERLWGAGDGFITVMNRAPLGVVLAALAGVTVGLAWLARSGCARVVGRPLARPTRRRGQSRPMPSTPGAATVQTLVRSAWRNRQVRTPVTALLLITATLAAVAGPTRPVVAVTCLGLPLTWALAFTRNFLALTGRAGVWLSSTPAGAERLLSAGTGLATVGGVLLPIAVWLPALAARRMDAADFGSVVAIAVSVGTLTTGSSVLYAVRHPEPADATGRAPLVSTGRAAAGSIRLAVPTLAGYVAASGGAVFLDSTDAPSLVTVLCGVAASMVAATGLLWWAWRTWTRPQVRSSALSVAGAIG